MPQNKALKEMVIGVVFKPIPEFKAAHYGLFWHRIRDRFPVCMDVPPLPSVLEGVSSGEMSFLPRVWYITRDEDRLLQIQPDRFLLNWRKREISDVYVGFEQCQKWFLDDLNGLLEFLINEGLGKIIPKQLELNYINHVSRDDLLGDLRNLSEIFPVLRLSEWSEDGRIPLPEKFSCQFQVVSPDHAGEMLITLATAIRAEDTMPIIHLSFQVIVPLPENESVSLEPTLNSAHDWIVHVFKGMVPVSALQKYWR